MDPGTETGVNERLQVPAGFVSDITVLPGPRLLSGVHGGPALYAHRRIWPEPARSTAGTLLSLTRQVDVRGRGGAGFPLARKWQTVMQSGKRRALVVNASEGEPGSAKDSALLLTAPHLVLDGAVLAARALGVAEIDIVVGGERPQVAPAVQIAIGERQDGLRHRLHTTTGGFVGGQAKAVSELIEGRENLPVTTWIPDAVKGLRGRPTLLSNAETYAQLAVLAQLGPERYSRAGLPGEPGTTLVTVGGDGLDGVVLEVEFGTPLTDILREAGFTSSFPVLMGGYHGAWLTREEITTHRLSRPDLARNGASLGAGVILPLDADTCPVTLTARIVDYLAGESAQRCGPCRNGLPALARATAALADYGHVDAIGRIRDLTSAISGRGACAHPDGTVRLVRSLFRAFPTEIAAHERRGCRVREGALVR
jgi:NADH:ubiquinone oxidoreductase subunit F (NADH-binding)